MLPTQIRPDKPVNGDVQGDVHLRHDIRIKRREQTAPLSELWSKSDHPVDRGQGSHCESVSAGTGHPLVV